MNITFKSHKPRKIKKGIVSDQQWIIVLNNRGKKGDRFDVINMPVTWCHKPSKVLSNIVGQWKIKQLK